MKNRVIGIRHRIKFSADGEARPTQVAILEDGILTSVIELADEQAELDFLFGVHPIHWRDASADDDISKYPMHQLKTRKPGDEEDVTVLPQNLVLKLGRDSYIVTKVPDKFVGLEADDTVAMPMGGSGDYFAYALSVQADKIGAQVMRVKPRRLKQFREDRSEMIDDDAATVANLFVLHPDDFHLVTAKERNMIEARELFRARQDAQKDRKACQQRLRQRSIGAIFVSPQGMYPQGGIEKQFDEIQASDERLRLLFGEEKDLERKLQAALRKIPAYTEIFEPIVGVGPVIAAGILCAVGDIRLFVRKEGNLQIRSGGLKKYCGVHVNGDGSFPRKRSGTNLGYNPNVRQALYLLADQFNRRPKTEWGMKLLANKAAYQARYPHPTLRIEKIDGVAVDPAQKLEVPLTPGTFTHNKAKGTYEVEIEGVKKIVTGKQQHSKGHLLKMALWRTLTHFVEDLYDRWSKLEGDTTPSDGVKNVVEGDDGEAGDVGREKAA